MLELHICALKYAENILINPFLNSVLGPGIPEILLWSKISVSNMWNLKLASIESLFREILLSRYIFHFSDWLKCYYCEQNPCSKPDTSIPQVCYHQM